MWRLNAVFQLDFGYRHTITNIAGSRIEFKAPSAPSVRRGFFAGVILERKKEVLRKTSLNKGTCPGGGVCPVRLAG